MSRPYSLWPGLGRIGDAEPEFTQALGHVQNPEDPGSYVQNHRCVLGHVWNHECAGSRAESETRWAMCAESAFSDSEGAVFDLGSLRSVLALSPRLFGLLPFP